MTDIEKRKETLPETIDKLQKFILIGKQKLKAQKAKYEAINIINDAKWAKDAALKDTQDLATCLLWAEAKLGKLLDGIDKSKSYTGFQQRNSVLPPGITKKQSHYAQELSKNSEIIDQIIDSAIKHKEIPRRRDVLKAIQDRKRETEKKELLSLPEGKYRIIYADPPWQYSNVGFDESAEQQYPTMPIEDICSLPVENLVTDRAVLFLWVTNAFLREGLEVCDAWGFEYKTNFVWIKNTGPSIGWFSKSRHELLFIATIGEGVHPKEKFISWFEFKSGQHSKKPDEVYGMIEQMYSGPYIELFAREKRNGWESWGNEIL